MWQLYVGLTEKVRELINDEGDYIRYEIEYTLHHTLFLELKLIRSEVLEKNGTGSITSASVVRTYMAKKLGELTLINARQYLYWNSKQHMIRFRNIKTVK